MADMDRPPGVTPDRPAETGIGAFEFAPVPLFVVEAGSAEPKILFVNRALAGLVGRTPGELIGQAFWAGLWPLYAAGADTAATDRLRAMLVKGEAGEIEIGGSPAGSTEPRARLVLNPALDEAGQMTGLVGAHLPASSEEVARQVGAFAHDFNNLLQVMVGYVAIILGTLDKPEPDQRRIRRGAEAIQAATARAATLIQSLGGLIRR